jgi:hypothetical protein
MARLAVVRLFARSLPLQLASAELYAFVFEDP